MKRTLSSILAVVMAMAMVMSFSAVAAERLYAAYDCGCEEACNHFQYITDGCYVPTSITEEGNVITQTMDAENLNGTVGAYFAITFEDVDIIAQYPYLVLDVKSNDGVKASFYGWPAAGREIRPFTASYDSFAPGKYVANLRTGDNCYGNALMEDGDAGFTCQVWMAGTAGAEWSFELYLTDDPDAVVGGGEGGEEGGEEGGAETGAESAIAVAAAAVIGAGALIVLSRKAK